MAKLDQVEVLKSGHVQIRFIKDDGGYHRTAVEPGGDIDAQIALVNAHLADMGHTPCEEADKVKEAVAQTKDAGRLVVTKFREEEARK